MRREIANRGVMFLVGALVAATGALAGEPDEQEAAAAPAPLAETAPVRPRYGLSMPTSPPRAEPQSAPSTGRGHPSPYRPMKGSDRSREFYRATWGIDRLRVSYTMSGNLIRFSFRVVEPKLAHPLGDHEATPQLYAPKAHAFLQVPTMEQVGPLRQLHTDKAGEEFWLLFSNKGNLVHKGDRVNLIIGKFHADGLVVE
jgi:hypothetical protein